MTEITLLDGSIGQELVKRSGDRATPLWSTQVMIDHPHIVREVHDAYYRSGATVASANTYALHLNRLERVGLENELERLVKIALRQACAARDKNGNGRVAGVMGPLLASYRPDLQPSVDTARRQFGALVSMMAGSVDLIILETVSSVLEAEGALSGTEGFDKPVWLALSVDDDDGTRLRSGEPLTDIRNVVDRFAPQAVLINCSRPEVIPAALAILKPLGRPFGAYANGFTRISEGFLEVAPTVDALDQRSDLGPEIYADHAMSWVAQGATIVGGCCEVGPGHIAELYRRLRAAGHTVI